MRAVERVGVLVEMRAVELREAVSVAGEMRGRPIENHTQSGLVTAIHKFHKSGGSAVAAGGAKLARGLEVPGAVERGLHYWGPLDRGGAQFLHQGGNARP